MKDDKNIICHLCSKFCISIHELITHYIDYHYYNRSEADTQVDANYGNWFKECK